jgi:hypothetical protein
MTHLLIWLLAYPLVAVVDTVARVQYFESDPGRLSQGHAAVYLTGFLTFLAAAYV